MSAIWSASSSVTKRTSSRTQVPCRTWSDSRPGVAMSRSTPRWSCVGLPAEGHPADDRAAPQAERLRERRQRVRDLHGELAGGHEDQAARVAGPGLALVQPGEQRQPEGERLARAGLRAAEHVTAAERVGQRGGLDGERLGDALRLEGTEQRRGQPQLGEGHRRPAAAGLGDRAVPVCRGLGRGLAGPAHPGDGAVGGAIDRAGPRRALAEVTTRAIGAGVAVAGSPVGRAVRAVAIGAGRPAVAEGAAVRAVGLAGAVAEVAAAAVGVAVPTGGGPIVAAVVEPVAVGALLAGGPVGPVLPGAAGLAAAGGRLVAVAAAGVGAVAAVTTPAVVTVAALAVVAVAVAVVAVAVAGTVGIAVAAVPGVGPVVGVAVVAVARVAPVGAVAVTVAVLLVARLGGARRSARGAVGHGILSDVARLGRPLRTAGADEPSAPAAP